MGTLHALQLHQLVQPDGIFIGGALAIGGDPPAPFDLVAVADGKDDIGVANINGEQHGPLPRYSAKTSPA